MPCRRLSPLLESTPRVRFLEFFAANIRNSHTRRAYGRAVAELLAWCDDAGVPSITAVQPLHVAAWIEAQTREHATRPSSCGLPRSATCWIGW